MKSQRFNNLCYQMKTRAAANELGYVRIEKLPVLLGGGARVATEVNEWQLIMQAQMSPDGALILIIR